MVDTMADFAAEREAMVELQLKRRGIHDRSILEAFSLVPRERFVASDYSDLAYGDHPLPIEAGQTISQPYIVALMIEAAAIAPTSKVLEVGAGSGYAAAIISRIAARVIGVERKSDLVHAARERLKQLGFDNVEIVEGDGSKGIEGQAPFDAIIAAASGSHVPRSLIDQLAPGGSIIMPVGDPELVQQLVKVTKMKDGTLQQSDLCQVRFVPLIGEEGWNDA